MAQNEKLVELASNAWWSWNRDAIDLFTDLNPKAFRQGGNSPGAALRNASPAILAGPDFQDRLNDVYDRFRSYLDDPGVRSGQAPVAYFCMDTEGPGHRIVDEFSGQTINTSQHLLIPLSSIVSSAHQVAASSSISRTCPAGVR